MVWHNGLREVRLSQMKIKVYMVLCILGLVLPGLAWGQAVPGKVKKPGPVRYQETWLSNDAGTPTDMAVDHLGNVHVTGFSGVTIKYNSNGHPLWKCNYFSGKDTIDIQLGVGLDFDGNVYVAGWSGTSVSFVGQWSLYYWDDWPIGLMSYNISLPGEDTCYTIIKYSPTGEQLWERHYKGEFPGYHIPTAMKVTPAGNVYVTGYSYGGGDIKNFDYLTVSYDTNGNLRWAARYDGGVQDTDQATALAVDDYDQVYVTGRSWIGANNFDYLTIKYSAIGQKMWEARYDGEKHSYDRPTSLAVDSRLNVYVTGYSDGNEADIVTIKYDRNGQQQWLNRYDGPGHYNDKAYDMIVDHNSGNVYVCGERSVGNPKIPPFPAAYAEFFVMKLNQKGNLEWQRRILSDFEGSRATRMVMDRYGDILVTGTQQFSQDRGRDWFTVKYSPQGAYTHIDKYDGPGGPEEWKRDDFPAAIGADSQGNVYVTGVSHDTHGDSNFATMKYTRYENRLRY